MKDNASRKIHGHFALIFCYYYNKLLMSTTGALISKSSAHVVHRQSREYGAITVLNIARDIVFYICNMHKRACTTYILSLVFFNARAEAAL